jgi:hypothetical protein
MRAQARYDEAVVDVEAAFPWDGQTAELVQHGEGLLNDVAPLGPVSG